MFQWGVQNRYVFSSNFQLKHGTWINSCASSSVFHMGLIMQRWSLYFPKQSLGASPGNCSPSFTPILGFLWHGSLPLAVGLAGTDIFPSEPAWSLGRQHSSCFLTAHPFSLAPLGFSPLPYICASKSIHYVEGKKEKGACMVPWSWGLDTGWNGWDGERCSNKEDKVKQNEERVTVNK